MRTTSLRLPEPLIASLDRIAAEQGTERSQVMREAAEAYVAAQRAAPDSLLARVDALVDYGGSGAGDLGVEGERRLRERFQRARPRPA